MASYTAKLPAPPVGARGFLSAHRPSTPTSPSSTPPWRARPVWAELAEKLGAVTGSYTGDGSAGRTVTPGLCAHRGFPAGGRGQRGHPGRPERGRDGRAGQRNHAGRLRSGVPGLLRHLLCRGKARGVQALHQPRGCNLPLSGAKIIVDRCRNLVMELQPRSSRPGAAAWLERCRVFASVQPYLVHHDLVGGVVDVVAVSQKITMTLPSSRSWTRLPTGKMVT